MKHKINIKHILNGRITIYLLIFIFSITSCKKLVEVDPPDTNITELNVYSNKASATAVLTGLYIKMSSSGLQSNGVTSMPLLTGLSGDELVLYSGTHNETYSAFYTNSLTSSNFGYPNPWSNLYSLIFTCNSAIEGLSRSSELTPSIKNQLLGEAKFLRAFYYFYLVNLFGDVPLALSTDYTVNSTLSRSPKDIVYQQIIIDLKEAQAILNDNYVDNSLVNATSERVRPNKWAAIALLARAYLYHGEYANAENTAAEVIGHTALYGLTGLNDVFQMNSREAIWQLQPVNNGFNTEDARLFIIPSTGLSDEWPVYLSNQLLNSFESGDQRKVSWISRFTDNSVTPAVDYYYSYKYKVSEFGQPVTEYAMVLRLSEQYLIRAEARAQQNKLSEAATDLDAIRQRAGVNKTTATAQTALLEAIMHERQVELFSEWGHRWLDLKRLNKVNEVMSNVTPLKGGIWNTNRQLYPIPAGEILKDPNLTQNPSY
ncbi:RagB/SusD family nutrient uptake outer membrane protein [Mucilaginibacter sp. R-33]|uniref:RagB/SusD family nutrient uptake outer membrane protein n=1 Tax=Mucilaginibacter sp. R-33 TaxID=3416711 RepID=UPI003CF9BE32